MIHIRRKNTAWLAALAAMITLALVAAPAAPVTFMLIFLFGLAALASMVEIGRERESIVDALRRAPVRQNLSPQAKEATERAKQRGGYLNPNLTMTDVGLIAVQTNYEGMAMRRSRNISKDDDGARPFVTLNVAPSEAERHAIIRFEIYNQQGDEEFVHEVRAFLREGEMNIMSDHHLPLAGNSEISGTGDWDLRVYVDGNLVAMHDILLTPSLRERQRRLSQEYSDQVVYEDYVVEEKAQEVPPRIQDLMQNNQQTSHRSYDTDTVVPPSANRSSDAPRRSRTASRRRR